MKLRQTIFGLAAGLCIAAAAQAQSVNTALSGVVMYGINRTNGNLVRHDFANSNTQTVAAIQDDAGYTLTGIDAGAYFAGNPNIYALWTSPIDGKNKLVYVDIQTGKAVIGADDLEGGRFTGAAGAATTADPYTVFAIQNAKIKPPMAISGLINLNPNNSNDNEFSCTKEGGAKFTRDHLAGKDIVIDANGTYYQGTATFVHVKPKGNGNQNGILLDGEAFTLQNSNTYDFSGAMQVRVFNDSVNNGKAMGKWWIQVISGTVTVNNDVQVLSPNRLTKVDQRTGVVTELMVLSRAYDGLATSDGKIFYTAFGKDLYKINLTSQSETKVGTTTLTKMSDMEFVSSFLISYDIGSTSVAPLNETNGQNLQSPSNLGMGDISVLLIAPVSNDPINWPLGAFD